MRDVFSPLPTPSAHLKQHFTRKNYIAWLRKQPLQKVVGSCKQCPIAYWLMKTLNISSALVDTDGAMVIWRGSGGLTTDCYTRASWLDQFIWWADAGGKAWNRLTAKDALAALMSMQQYRPRA